MMQARSLKSIFLLPLLTLALLGTAGCSLVTIASSSEEVTLREVPVQRVNVEIGVGSPIPVNVVAEGEWPDLCGQVARIDQSFDGSTFEVILWASPEDPDCPPDNLGLPFRIAVPLNMVEVPAGNYAVTVNGVTSEFAWPPEISQEELPELATEAWSLAFIGRDGNVWVKESESDPKRLTGDGTAPNTNWQGLEVVTNYSSPSLSSDGSLVAVRRDAGQAVDAGFDFSYSLNVIEVATGNSRQVIAKAPAGFGWQPGTHQLVYGLGVDERYFVARGQLDSDRASGLMLYDYATGAATELVAPERGFSLVSPKWSADGRYLGFNEVVAYEGSGPFAYYDLQNGDYISWEQAIGLYAWSPVDDRIAYDMLVYTPTGDERIFLNELRGGAEVEFTPADIQGFAFQPIWSPDGEAIAYFSGIPDSSIYSLWTKSVAGGEAVFLGQFESVMNPAWTADGSQVVFSAGQHPEYRILAVDALDGTITALAEGSDPSLATGG